MKVSKSTTITSDFCTELERNAHNLGFISVYFKIIKRQ